MLVSEACKSYDEKVMVCVGGYFQNYRIHCGVCYVCLFWGMRGINNIVIFGLVMAACVAGTGDMRITCVVCFFSRGRSAVATTRYER